MLVTQADVFKGFASLLVYQKVQLENAPVKKWIVK